MSDDQLNPKMSTSIDELAAALCKAQGQFGAAKKDGKNPHFRSTFATLESVIDAVREPLYEAGLSFMQPTVYHPEGLGLVTILLHSSGQFISSLMVLPADIQTDKESGERIGRTDVQACGSTIQYMRRYALLAMLGVPTEDDDGEGSRPRTLAPGDRYAEPTPHQQARGVQATEKQVKMFYALTRKLELSDDAIQAGIDSRGHPGASFKDLTSKQASEILSNLKDSMDSGIRKLKEQADG